MLAELRLSEGSRFVVVGSCLVGGSCLVVGGSFPVQGNNWAVAQDGLHVVNSKEGAQTRVPHLFSQRSFCLYGRALNINKKQWFGKQLFHTGVVIFIWLFEGACFERDLLVENDFSKLTRGYSNTNVYLHSLGNDVL